MIKCCRFVGCLSLNRSVCTCGSGRVTRILRRVDNLSTVHARFCSGLFVHITVVVCLFCLKQSHQILISKALNSGLITPFFCCHNLISYDVASQTLLRAFVLWVHSPLFICFFSWFRQISVNPTCIWPEWDRNGGPATPAFTLGCSVT